MPRQEELELELRDSITPGLKAIAVQLRELNKAARESAAQTSNEIDRMAGSTKSFGVAAKAASKEVNEMFKTIVDYGKTILGVGGTYEAVKKLTEGLTDLASTRVQLAMFSQDTRISADEITRMHGAMTRMGVDVKQADTYIAGLSNKLQELTAMREGSKLFQDLEKMGSGGAALGRKLLDEKDVTKQIKLITEVFKTQTPEVQFYLSQMLGVPVSVLANLDAYEKKVGQVIEIPAEVAQKYQDQLATFNERADAEWKIFGSHALEAINGWFDKLNAMGMDQESHGLSKFLIGELDAIDKGIANTTREVKFFISLLDQIKAWGDWVIDKWRPDLAAKREKDTSGNPEERLTGSFEAVEKMRLAQENNKLLAEIRDTLTRGVGDAGGGGVGIRGGGIAGGGRAASAGDVTGPMQAGRGGFRPSVKGGDRAAVDARTFGTLAEQRAPYLKYLNDHPELKNKLGALLLSEEPSREGRVGTAETFLNRMISHGIPPEKMGTSIEGLASGPGVYYQPLRPGGTAGSSAERLASDPQLQKQTMEDIDKAGAGSNVSGLGTQNASAGVAGRAQGLQTVTREAIKGISDQWSRKDVHPEEHGPGTVAREKNWFEQTQQAMKARKNLDETQRSKSVFEKGTASVTVDFGDTKQRTNESAEGGKVFKPLNNQREPQSPKAGDAASFNDRWHFQ